MNANEYYKQLLERQLKYLHIDEYHKLGYAGEGVVILNAENNNNHGEKTSGIIKDYAPGCTLLESVWSAGYDEKGKRIYGLKINEEKLGLEEAIDKYNIKIITRSYAGSITKEESEYFKNLQREKGIIMLCSAGNRYGDRVDGCWSKHDTAITVASVHFVGDKIKASPFNSIGDEIDFVMFMGREDGGTSFSNPALAGMIALLLQRYGNFNQAECVEILKSLCVDLGNVGKDNIYGWGLPILPLTDKLEILERMRGEKMPNFKDVEEGRWSKKAIDFCVEKGLLVGFEDNTFKPTEFVTREQMATILQRIYTK